MSDDKIGILDTIEWALETKREQLLFGLDPLSAALARERRLFAVLLDCKEALQQKDKVIEIYRKGLIELLPKCYEFRNDGDVEIYVDNVYFKQIEDLTHKEKE